MGRKVVRSFRRKVRGVVWGEGGGGGELGLFWPTSEAEAYTVGVSEWKIEGVGEVNSETLAE